MHNNPTVCCKQKQQQQLELIHSLIFTQLPSGLLCPPSQSSSSHFNIAHAPTHFGRMCQTASHSSDALLSLQYCKCSTVKLTAAVLLQLCKYHNGTQHKATTCRPLLLLLLLLLIHLNILLITVSGLSADNRHSSTVQLQLTYTVAARFDGCWLPLADNCPHFMQSKYSFRVSIKICTLSPH